MSQITRSLELRLHLANVRLIGSAGDPDDAGAARFKSSDRSRSLQHRSRGRTLSAGPRRSADNTRLDRQSGWFRVPGQGRGGRVGSVSDQTVRASARRWDSVPPSRGGAPAETRRAVFFVGNEEEITAHGPKNHRPGLRRRGIEVPSGVDPGVGRDSRLFCVFRRLCPCDEGVFDSVPASRGLRLAWLRAPRSCRG